MALGLPCLLLPSCLSLLRNSFQEDLLFNLPVDVKNSCACTKALMKEFGVTIGMAKKKIKFSFFYLQGLKTYQPYPSLLLLRLDSALSDFKLLLLGIYYSCMSMNSSE